MNKRKSPHLLALEFARDIEKQTGRPVDVKDIEAFEQMEQAVQRFEQMKQALRQTSTVLARLAAAQPKAVAARIEREHAAIVAGLKRHGVRRPAARAWEWLAKRYGHASGPALKKWVARNR